MPKNGSYSDHAPRTTTSGVDYTSLSSNALIFRGTQNLPANREAQRVLDQRGHTGAVSFLRDFEIILANPQHRTVCDFWRYASKPGRDSWLHVDDYAAKCRDCGQPTSRTYNRNIFQCPGCAEGVREHGRFTWKIMLDSRKITRAEPPKSSGENVNTQLRYANMTAFELGVAAANAQLEAIGRAAYEAVMTGPMTPIVDEIEEMIHARHTTSA